MIYLLYGTDTEQARKKAHQLYESLLKKKPDASFFRIDSENWDENSFDEKIESQGLFENKYIVFLNTVFQNTDAKETLLGKLKEVAASQNIFIVLEGKLDKASLTKLEKVAEKSQAFDLDEKKMEEFNIFSLTDAFGKRDKKDLWILFSKAKMRNIPAEEIHGILFWQLKTILLTSESSSAEEAGLKPFVYSKAKSFVRNFSPEELRRLSASLVGLYHDARRGIHDMDTALERFVLGL
jgi:DNA polymerase III delta subunit